MKSYMLQMTNQLKLSWVVKNVNVDGIDSKCDDNQVALTLYFDECKILPL